MLPLCPAAFASFPQVASITEDQQASNTGNHVISLPATVEAGDLLLMLVCVNTWKGLSAPAGWTELVHSGYDGNGTGAVYARDAVGDEDGGTVTVSHDSADAGSHAAHVYRISAASWGGDIATAIDVGTTAIDSGASVTVDPPGVMAGGGLADNLFITFLCNGDDGGTVSAYPANYTNGVDTVSGAGENASQSAASARRELAAASDNPSAFTLSEVEGWMTNTLVIAPAGDLQWQPFNFFFDAGAGSIEIGTAYTYDVRQHLFGDNAATATITIVNPQGDDPFTHGWAAPGTGSNVTNDATVTGDGCFFFLATGSAGSVQSDQSCWEVKQPPSGPLQWESFSFFNDAGAGNIEVGTPFTYNVRQHLLGSEAATATITIVQQSGDDAEAAGWIAPGTGDVVTYDCQMPGGGSFAFLATGVNSSAQDGGGFWECTDPGAGGGTATLFVAEGGSDATLCTGAAPCATVERAMDLAAAGDVIEMQATDGVWNYTNFTTFDDCGAPNQEIVLRVRDGDRINFYPSGFGPSPHAVWHVAGSACYLLLDGSLGEMYVGDRSLWNGTNGGTENYPYNYSLYGSNPSHHIHIRNVHFAGGDAPSAMQLENTTHHWFFDHITASGDGRVTDTGTHLDDGLRIAGDHHLIIGADLSAPYGGHHSASFFANWQVIRDVTFNMDWGLVTDQSNDSGYRAFAAGVNLNAADAMNSQAPWGPTLLEGNIVTNAGWVEQSGGTNNNASHKFATSAGSIQRYNYFYDNPAHQSEAAGTSQPPPPPVEVAEHSRSYNNTYFNIETWTRISAGPHADGIAYPDMEDRRYFNNMLANVTGVDNPNHTFVDHLVFYFNTDRLTLQGHPNHWLGARFECNVIDAPVAAQSIRMMGTGGNTADSVAEAESLWPDVWSDNIVADPVFVNAAARTKAGFALAAGSPGKDAACAMATVTSASSGTTVSLGDTYWIYDGANPATWDLAYYGEEGDWIAFFDSSGTNNLKGIRQVFSVNSQTSITLTSPISVAFGDTVFPVLSDGTTIVRDVGATQ